LIIASGIYVIRRESSQQPAQAIAYDGLTRR